MDTESLLRKDELSTDQWITYLLKLWSGLVFYHKHSFVHGDIKPANIAYVRGRGLFFNDYDWSRVLDSCDEIQEQLSLVKGITYEYWTPMIRNTDQSCDEVDLLYFNDCYGLAVVTYKICKKLKIEFGKTYCLEIIKVNERANVQFYTAKKILSQLKILLK
jgi:serine/threonine protein kinase